MRSIVLIIALAIVAIGGEWLYRSFLRPVDPIPHSVLALAQHFNQAGIAVQAFPLRHGFRHSQVTAAAYLRIDKFPLVISVVACPSEAAAQRRLEAVKASPNLMHPAKNGSLVMYLPAWAGDEPMAQRISAAFQSFDSGA